MPNSTQHKSVTTPPSCRFEANRRPLLGLAALLAIAAVALLAACGPAAYVAPPITVAFTPGFTPPTAMTFNPPEQCGVAATVTNDSKNQGVTWTAACSTAPCGTFTPTNASASTIPITYTAPATAGDTVTLTATSVTDPTKKAVSSPITIGQSSAGCAP